MHRWFTDWFFRVVRLRRLRIAILYEATRLIDQDSNIKNVDDSDVESVTDEADLARQKSEFLKRVAAAGF
jgi:hypothetical protein